MATTRPVVVPQQARGEEIVGGAAKQQQKKGDGGNRRALGDIGNLVTVRGVVEGKNQPQIGRRPITRSFCAQLLANAQAAAAAENNKKQICVNVDKASIIVDGIPAGKKPVAAKAAAAAENNKKQVCVNVDKAILVDGNPAGKKPVAAKAALKKVNVKPNPKEEVIEISSDDGTSEKVKEADKSAKKKKLQPTLTSVLTARSKAACGLANKPKEKIIDIDAADAGNDLAGVEYVEDIYEFYKLVEHQSRPHNYMHTQTEVNEKMRAILVDWLIDVHQKFELSPETLYLTINIIDRFLGAKVVSRKELQLVGMSAMLMASKYEEIWAPEVNDLVCIADRVYSHEQILVMEKIILGKLEWTLTVPTHYVFLARFIKASLADKELENMVYFLAELGVMNYDTIMYCPSMVAASAVYAARCTLNKTPLWTETLKLHTGISEAQLMDCAKLLVYFHSKAAESKLKVVYRKYSSPQRGAVALLPPAKTLLSGDAALKI